MTPGMTLRTNFATNRMARYSSMLSDLGTGFPDMENPESMVPGVLQMFVGAVDIQVIDKLWAMGKLKPLAFSLHPESVVYA